VPNLNYRAGVRLEYGRKKHWAKRGYIVMRSSGSHGVFDLVCFRPNEIPMGIQCKRVSTVAEAKRLINGFKTSPPITPCGKYRQLLEVQVKGSSEILSVEV